MNLPNSTQSQSSNNQSPNNHWTGTQAYVLAVFCLVLGVIVGYLFRGSASPATQTAAATAPSAASQQPDPNSQAASTQSASNQAASNQAASNQSALTQAALTQAALTQATAPLLDAVNRNPNDYDSLVKLGNVFYDAQQFPNAIQYYERALALHPENPDVRTDMGTAYWYAGDADKAIAAMETSLKYRPGHPQTLFNLGWIRWQGKADPKGAVDDWEKLLKANPAYPQRQKVEEYIAKAKEHAARG